jgi:hypothetical protein
MPFFPSFRFQEIFYKLVKVYLINEENLLHGFSVLETDPFSVWIQIHSVCGSGPIQCVDPDTFCVDPDPNPGVQFWIRTLSVCGSRSIQFVDLDPFSVWIRIHSVWIPISMCSVTKKN